MSTDPVGATNEQTGELRDEDRSEMDQRAAYEAEMSRISSADMILQAAVSLLNIGGYRLGLSAGQGQPTSGARDLEQVRDAIDGARALLPILERRQPNEMRPLRDALSQLQMAYAREAGASAPADPASGQAHPGPEQDRAAASAKPSAPAGAESSGPAGAGEPNAPAGAGEPSAPTPNPPASAEPSGPAGAGEPSGPGPAESSGRLWVPGR